MPLSNIKTAIIALIPGNVEILNRAACQLDDDIYKKITTSMRVGRNTLYKGIITTVVGGLTGSTLIYSKRDDKTIECALFIITSMGIGLTLMGAKKLLKTTLMLKNEYNAVDEQNISHV